MRNTQQRASHAKWVTEAPATTRRPGSKETADARLPVHTERASRPSSRAIAAWKRASADVPDNAATDACRLRISRYARRTTHAAGC
eukprot:scaffold24937_cov140-Isochrysis_galbana.AAC.4